MTCILNDKTTRQNQVNDKKEFDSAGNNKNNTKKINIQKHRKGEQIRKTTKSGTNGMNEENGTHMK